jgi:hypothetical protein
MGSLVRTLNDHLKSEPEPPDLRPSSNVDFPVAWITGPATDPSRFNKVSHLWLEIKVKNCEQVGFKL